MKQNGEFGMNYLKINLWLVYLLKGKFIVHR